MSEDHRPALLAIGDRMNRALIEVITNGYARGVSEEQMVASVWKKTVDENSHLLGAMVVAALFQLAQATKWDLVLARPDGTRVVIHCDTEEEQSARAREIATEQGQPIRVTGEIFRGIEGLIEYALNDVLAMGNSDATFVRGMATNVAAQICQNLEAAKTFRAEESPGDKGEK